MRENKLPRSKKAFEKYKSYKKDIVDKNLPLPGIKLQKPYYLLTQILLKLITLAGNERICFLNEKKVNTPKNRPVIFANTHKFKPDIEKIAISLGEPSALIASDFINSYKTISGWYFKTRPTIFVDPYSKEDKHYSYKMMLRYLMEGHNFSVFPEAVWNLSENKIVLDTFFGTAKAALESNAVIVCTAIERYGKTYVINRRNYIDPLSVLKKYTDKTFSELSQGAENSKIAKTVLERCNREIRDNLATLTFEIWESEADKNGLTSRKSLPDDYWDNFVSKLTSEWKGYKMSDNVEQRFHSKAEIEAEEIACDLAKIQPTKQNAFLFNKRLKGLMNA